MTLSIEAQWENLDAGSPEERACFAALGIQANDTWLTEAEDSFVKTVRQRVYLSGYHLAEWLAWNWWRLRWEPRSDARKDWVFAHRLATIGGGYVWPNLTVFSDGQRIAFYSRPTTRSPAESLHYICDSIVIVPAADFEQALDDFFGQVEGRLETSKVTGTNLKAILADLRRERAQAELAQRRRLEAILGFDLDEAPESLLRRLSDESVELGHAAVEELAADRSSSGNEPWTKGQLEDFAGRYGTPSRSADHVTLTAFTGQELVPSAETPAWVLGARAAKALREQERLGDAPLLDVKLAKFFSLNAESLFEHNDGPPISFALDDRAHQTRIVLRQAKWRTSRRFDAARLLGDRLLRANGGRLFPATRSYTYRQKWQRSFAAELLCPYEALKGFLEGDFSDEALEAAAQHFNVSALTVRTLLVNHDDLPRGELNDTAAAA